MAITSIDPDERPAHRDPVLVLLVFAGGTVGTAVRALIGVAILPVDGVPLATIGINVVGSFALGLLTTGLARGGPDTGTRLRLRLGLGTGLIGGFTTYSAFAVDSATIAASGRPGVLLLYAVGSVLAGIAAAAAGAALVRRAT